MPYAVELFLREDNARIVDAFWEWENEHGLGREMDGRPHVTLGVWDTFELETVVSWLRSLCRETAPMAVQFASIGVFPNHPSVLFIAPVVTSALLDFQTAVITGLPADPQRLWANYIAGQWVPHCTLGMQLEADECLAALARAHMLPLPIEAVLDRLAIVEIPAVLNHFTAPLTGRS